MCVCALSVSSTIFLDFYLFYICLFVYSLINSLSSPTLQFMRYKTEQKSAGPSSPLDYTSSNMSLYPSSYSTFSSSFLSSSSPSSYTSPFKLSWDKPTTTGPSLYPSTSSGPSLYPSTSTGPSLYPVTSTGSSLHSSTNSYLPPLASKPGGAFSYTSGISKPTANAAQSPLSSVS